MAKKEKIISELKPEFNEIAFVEGASRIELFVRIVWIFAAMVVLLVYNFVYSLIILIFGVILLLLNFLNWFYTLIFGKRWETAFSWAAEAIYNRYVRYMVNIFNYTLRQLPYLLLMTDSRPELLKMGESSEKYFKQLKKK